MFLALRFAEKLASGGAVFCLEAVLHPFWQKKGERAGGVTPGTGVQADAGSGIASQLLHLLAS
eukprot:725586-Pelagomonas_calceolata.AAC.4